MRHSAAIGSARLAQLSELEILARDVDDDNSSTRYILLGTCREMVPWLHAYRLAH